MNPTPASTESIEVAWFSALCDDDYVFLGVPDPTLESSWDHCASIVTAADRHNYDNVLLPSGYALGIDNAAFAAAIATRTEQIRLLLAIRMGEFVAPQVVRQVATLQQIAAGRLTINIISSDLPGKTMASEPRYRRSTEYMHVIRELLDGRPVDFHGEFLDLTLDPPRIAIEGSGCPPYYFGGLSEAARECAARAADVFLMWPDVVSGVKKVKADMDAQSGAFGRTLAYGWRSHVIVRETEDEARAAARRLLSKLDDATGAEIRARSLDSKSAGVARQAELREGADEEGYASRHLWTGVGRARSGAGAAIVGDPDQVRDTILELAEAGMSAFILSGYPHLAECDLFARYVLPELNHGRLEVEPQPVVLSG